MSASQRRKGRVGQSTFARLLAERDWTVDPITAGIKREDMVATDPEGTRWSVEVKNCASITPAHRKQAMEQAQERGLRWMLANKLSGTGCWLVQRQGATPTIWQERQG